jgi:hypothetical protein
LLHKVIHKSTPSSSGRNRKKSKHTNHTQINLLANASDGDYDDHDDHLPTIQLEMLLNTNTSAISNALNTSNDSINMLFNLLQQGDLPETRQKQPPNEQDDTNRDLGNPYTAAAK